ncbi:MAG: RNA polymerase sigma-54 factor [Firmicutes bacterium HGW-Firmicutes-15]|nr:MAG: RNA polymerase sigma-54 factor [Firmicutes bacterium HGW-Firmicutes-15]
MRLSNDMLLEQQQKLIMTPELRLAIAILQMSTLELGEYTQNELEENPLLEEKEVEDAVEENSDHENEKNAETIDKTAEWLEYFNDRDIGFPINDLVEKSFDNFLTQRPSLYEHLQFQLHLACKNVEDMAVGQYIIGNLDPHGYLCVEPEEVAAKTGADLDQIHKVISLVQSFHPHGVGAYNLGECLLIQLRHYGKENDMVREIIAKHLDDLAKGKLGKIAQALGITICEVQEICDLIRTLDPKPGLQYSPMDEVKYIIPDVIVEKVEGEYVVVLNDSASPRLMVNQLYENMLRQPGAFSPEACKYLEEKMGAAVWLIRSIEQRRRTLYKVARCIVDFQTEFLNHGIKCLKPLNLKQVADIIEVHESTVSRATSKKYIQTSQGLFELKYFFGSGVENQTDHGQISSKSIKRIVEEIIDNENTAHPVSDQTIVEILKIKGINISRRTVAKYRQEMGILPTTSRKRY